MALTRSALAVGLLLALAIHVPSVAHAQRRGLDKTTAVRPIGGQLPGQLPGRAMRGESAGRAAFQDTAALANRRLLVQQVNQRFNRQIRTQLDLPDDKWRQLQSVQGRFTRQRNELQRSEHQTRLDLKAAMADSVPDQNKIDQYMSQLLQAGHRRADLLDAEQKELSGFLTPLQRAKYQSLHEQLTRRIMQLSQPNGRGAAPSPDTPPGPPPAR